MAAALSFCARAKQATRREKVTLIAMLFVSTVGLPIIAFWQSNDVCASVMVFVALHAVMGRQRVKTVSVRRVVLTAIATELVSSLNTFSENIIF